jgi:hypothetical protein
MLFLVELDHVRSGAPSTPEAGRAFIEKVILPTLARAEQLVKEKRILSGGPVLGRVALRFIMEADSARHADRMITSLPIWPMAETRVTPVIAFGERGEHVKELLARIAASEAG